MFCARLAAQEQVGSIRGVVYDKDFDAPLALAQVLLVETGEKVSAADQGNYSFAQVVPGRYTLVFSKDGYVRQVKSDVVVAAGRLTDVDAWLAGEFTDMSEFVVQDILAVGGSSEAALLALRFESPSFMDTIGADLMSKAGASDAASALTLVAGASVQDGKFAVIRGLPDRYVSSQMNGVRLPTADEDKRAVELDQFPSAVIESIQVSKTFTPDQQGDASGGAVDVRLKGLPDENLFQIKTQVGYNDQAGGRSDFLTYKGGGVGTWGLESGDKDVQFDDLGSNWDGAVGTSRTGSPLDYKLSMSLGGKRDLDDGLQIGAFASVFYERDSSYYDDGENNSYWVDTAGGKLVPEAKQGTVEDGDFKTALFDITQGVQEVKWGGLGTVGVESEDHLLTMTYLYTHSAEDKVTLAEDTRGKEYFFPGYDPDDPTGTGNTKDELSSAPYLRTETLEYTERTTETLQLHGRHTLDTDSYSLGDLVTFRRPELDWTVSHSSADLDQPDKRQFGALWKPASFNPGTGPFIPPSTSPAVWQPYKPDANFTYGNLQRTWKRIEEQSDQYSVNLKLPFDQWDEQPGYVRMGVFEDHVERTFDQDSYGNFSDNSSFEGGWDQPWSSVFPLQNHPITASTADVDYAGDQRISAWYSMLDVPLTPSLNLIGGARFERTKTSIVNTPEADAVWFPPGEAAQVNLDPGDPAANAQFEQRDLLPSIGLVYQATEDVTLRTSYSETVARQTFKELTPILQQEFLGGPIFIGNPDLTMSALKNYDVRVDYTPYDAGLFSLSWFKKDIDRPIEYVQTYADFTYTTPVNYPKGELSGYEVETRHDLGHFWEDLEGLGVGANATFIDSVVSLPADEVADFVAVETPITERDMTNAPDHLYNLYLTYDLSATETEFALFYTVKGDTLVAGSTVSKGNFVPSIYAKEYGTLNLSVSQAVGEHSKLQFQAKNLTDPRIEEVYRSDFTGGDVTRSTYTRGREFSLSLSGRF